jgi:hypothetical protein
LAVAVTDAGGRALLPALPGRRYTLLVTAPAGRKDLALGEAVLYWFPADTEVRIGPGFTLRGSVRHDAEWPLACGVSLLFDETRVDVSGCTFEIPRTPLHGAVVRGNSAWPSAPSPGPWLPVSALENPTVLPLGPSLDAALHPSDDNLHDDLSIEVEEGIIRLRLSPPR